MTPGEELLFCALGGSGEIGMNVNLYGTQGRWLMVDLGLTFADPDYPGIDLILPELEFIEQQRDKLAGIVLTHGHEDHIGAIPYLAADLKVPLYATAFTAGLITEKLAEEGLTGQVKLNVVARDASFEVGPFKLTYVALAHSIPEGNGLLIGCDHGRVFHTGDWKIDETPVLGEPSSHEALEKVGDKGVLALVCDSTNVFQDAPSGSESSVHEGLLREVERARGRVVVTTFASNAARLQTIGRVANETGRRVCMAGRSLGRIALGNHDNKLTEGDTVIFSSKIIPGNEAAIGRIMNALSDLGVIIVTERQAHVHVSGHPGRPELAQMYDWIRPEIIVPVHGEPRHMAEHARFALSHGVPKASLQRNGDLIRLAPDGPEKLTEVRVGRLVLDGDVILPADGTTITERRRMSYSGLVTVALPVGSDGGLAGTPFVRPFGLPVEEDRDDFIADATNSAERAYNRDASEDQLREAVRLAVRRCATAWTGKKPLVEVMLVRSN